MEENTKVLEHSLKHKWVLWFHKVDDENWKEESYIKVYDIETYEDILFVIQEIPNITSGMFFLMKRGIFPTYEDPENQNGGILVIKDNEEGFL